MIDRTLISPISPSVATACLKDLQRFFRFDNQTERRAFFAISKYNFARSDLVPLILAYPEDYDVVFNACTCQCAVTTIFPTHRTC